MSAVDDRHPVWRDNPGDVTVTSLRLENNKSTLRACGAMGFSLGKKAAIKETHSGGIMESTGAYTLLEIS